MAQEPKAPKEIDPSRRDPAEDPKFGTRPLADPSGLKGDIPENPDPAPGTVTTHPDGSTERAPGTTGGTNAPGTIVTDQGTGQSREILMPDGTPAGARTQTPGGGDAVPSWGEPDYQVKRAEAKALPTEAEALEELRANPQRTSVLSDKGHVTRDRLQHVRMDIESDTGLAEVNVRTEKNGNVTVDKAPV